MRPYRSYIIFFVVLLVGYTVYQVMKGPETHWQVTFKTFDKSPFGTYLLHERAADVTKQFSTSHQTLSQLALGENVLLLADNPEIGLADLTKMYEMLDAGQHVLIGANRLGKSFSDSLGVKISFQFNLYGQGMLEAETEQVTMGERTYDYPIQMLSSYFELQNPENWTVLASTLRGPMAIKRPVRNGYLILVTNPLIFTNFGMLYNQNHGLAARLISEINDRPVHYTMFYQFGRKEASTPLRYFLSQPALRWSIYTCMFAVLVLLGVDSWRKQRAIPVILPPENTSVLYAQTLGGLFHQEGNHYKTAMKIIHHFFGQIRERYWLEPEFTDKFYQQLAGKSGMELEHVKETFRWIELARKSPLLSESQLVQLSQKIDAFK